MDIKEIDNSKGLSNYRIVVQGDLNDSWSEWLGEASFVSMYQELISKQTVIVSALHDQAGLRGLMNRIWDLNLTIISVNFQKYESNGGTNEF